MVHRDGVEGIKASNNLMGVVGLKLHNNPDFNSKNYHKFKDQSIHLECCDDYYIWYLEQTT